MIFFLTELSGNYPCSWGCRKIHRTIIETYRQDFSKYATKYQIDYIDLIYNNIPRLLGRKFQYAHIPGDFRARALKPALALLLKAGVVHQIVHTKATGIPLAAEINPDKFKIIFLDVALAQTLLGSETKSWILEPNVQFSNKGSITEAFAGQELLSYGRNDVEQRLFYWHREARSSSAELDYVIQKKDQIVPIEVKSGAPGTLKSMRLFLDSHANSSYGIRFSSMNYEKTADIYNYPLYAIGHLFQQEKIH